MEEWLAIIAVENSPKKRLKDIYPSARPSQSKSPKWIQLWKRKNENMIILMNLINLQTGLHEFLIIFISFTSYSSEAQLDNDHCHEFNYWSTNPEPIYVPPYLSQNNPISNQCSWPFHLFSYSTTNISLLSDIFHGKNQSNLSLGNLWSCFFLQ